MPTDGHFPPAGGSPRAADPHGGDALSRVPGGPALRPLGARAGGRDGPPERVPPRLRPAGGRGAAVRRVGAGDATAAGPGVPRAGGPARRGRPAQPGRAAGHAGADAAPRRRLLLAPGAGRAAGAPGRRRGDDRARGPPPARQRADPAPAARRGGHRVPRAPGRDAAQRRRGPAGAARPEHGSGRRAPGLRQHPLVPPRVRALDGHQPAGVRRPRYRAGGSTVSAARLRAQRERSTIASRLCVMTMDDTRLASTPIASVMAKPLICGGAANTRMPLVISVETLESRIAGQARRTAASTAGPIVRPPRTSSLNRSKISTFASTAMPTLRMNPASPASVSVIANSRNAASTSSA